MLQVILLLRVLIYEILISQGLIPRPLGRSMLLEYPAALQRGSLFGANVKNSWWETEQRGISWLVF